MAQYYCHNCGVSASLIGPSPINPWASSSQQDKFVKHTSPSILESGLHSIFLNPKLSNYQALGASGYANACVEIDYYGHANLLWDIAYYIGFTCDSGCFQCFGKTLKIVQADQPQKAHWYPTASSVYLQFVNCQSCGRPALS